MRATRFVLAAALLAGGIAPPAAAAQEQTGTVAGQVTDRATARPVQGAAVTVQGTALRAVSDAAGRYRLSGVPAGSRRLSAAVLGYAPQERAVDVAAGGSAAADFALQPSAVAIEGVVATASGRGQRQREIGSVVGVIDVARVEMAPVDNFTQLLQARSPGVSVVQSGGTAGAGARVRIRGNASISLNNAPLLVVDGIRVDNTENDFALFTGGQAVSRFNDLNPEEIESVEILKGPAAAALYGTAAANGVIQVTTRRGTAGRPSWRFWAEGSTLERTVSMPANVLGYGTLINGAQGRCDFFRQGAGTCVGGIDSVRTFNPLEDPEFTPFRTGSARRLGTSVSGGSEAATYFVSGELEEETGVQRENDLRRVNLRANLSGRLSQNLRVQTNVGWVKSDIQLPQNDNSGLGVLFNGLNAPPTPGIVNGNDGYLLPREAIFAWDQFQDLSRLTGSAQAEWTPLPWLRVNAVAGLDQAHGSDNDLLPPGTPGLTGVFGAGFREVQNNRTSVYTAVGSATATWQLGADLVSTTSTGVQYHRNDVRAVFASGVGLTPGIESLAGLAGNFQVGEASVSNVTLGAFLQEQLAWRDRVFVNLALRGDRNSAFGTNLGWVWYPSLSGAWVVSEEPFFPTGSALSLLRLRFSYGRSGLQPAFRDAVTTFAAVTAATQAGDVPGFAVNTSGNADLEPETSSEYEAGLEAALLDDRVGVQLTWFRKDSENSLLNRVLAPSLGGAALRRENLGSVRNTGWEVEVRATPVRTAALQWTVRASGAAVRNRLESLGGVPDIIFGLNGDTQRHKEGFPLGSYFQRPIVGFEDANGDGLLGPGEVEVGDEPESLGTPFPTREASFSTELAFRGVLRLSGLVDYKGGHRLLNWTQYGRCVQFNTCAELYEPGLPLHEQAKIAAAKDAGTAAGFIEDAGFVKLREVALTFVVPQRWRRPLGSRELSFTLAGRNLRTWTGYTGFDPEVLGGGQANFLTVDNTTLPPSRAWTLRADLSF